MQTMRVEQRDQVAIITLNRGVTNAISLQLANELAETLQELEHDSNVRSLVLASSNDKFFSIGFDIPQLYELGSDDFRAFYRAFNRASLALYTWPKPTVAAITGHATAGGCILALCCDYRFMAQGRKFMGLNEVKLGVPVPYLIDCALRDLIGGRNAREVLETGEFYQPKELLRKGMVDQVLPLEQVLTESIKRARSLGAMPQQAFAAIKRNRVEVIEAQALARRDEEEQLFVEFWYSDEARARLKEAIKSF